MTGLDPAAATAAYLQRLPAAARAAAPARTALAEGLAVAAILAVVLACWILARSGLLVRMRENMRAGGRPPWMADAACGSLVAGAAAVACTPLGVIGALPMEADAAASLVAALRLDCLWALAGAVLAPLLLGLVRLRPRWWPVISGGVLGAAAFAAIFLPFATASVPSPVAAAPQGAARTGLMQLAADTRLPVSQVYISSNPEIDADVMGVGQARVVVSRGLWTEGSPAEIRASVGHLMGHYAHHDQLSIAILFSLLTVGLFVAAKALFVRAARLSGAPGLSGPADPAGLPVLLAVAALYFAGATVVEHGFIRWINVRADQYSLDHARAPDGLAVALLHEWRGEAVDPSPVQEALFYDHPSLRSRLEHAMAWKAAHPQN